MRVFVILPLIVLLSIFCFGQSANSNLRFEVPSKYVSVLLVPDLNCPVKLSGPAKVIGWSYGGLSLDFNLQNVSAHNIESFTIKETNWLGSNGYDIPYKMKENMFFVPLMSMSARHGDDKDSLAPFEEKRAGEILYTKNRIWIAMVTKVRLSDGTTYDASKEYQELENFIDKQREEFESATINLDQRERNLREFVEKLMSKKI